MKATYIEYHETNSFSSTALSYLAGDSKIQPFISHFPTIANFGHLIESRRVTTDRKVLRDVLTRQYSETLDSGLPSQLKVNENIELLLRDTTYTITTGHQLNIFTGPLYFIYKIVTTINLSRELKQAYPDKDFVPVYWMATEDHDFAEINHVKLFGKNINWELNASGATGRLNPETIAEALKAYQSTLGISKNSERLTAIIEEAYLHHDTLASATRYLVNALFSSYGLVIVDADEKDFKAQFTSVIEDDIFNKVSSAAITKATNKLKEAGFDPQVNSRDINFFYMKDNLRERLVEEKGVYYLLNSEIRFNAEELRNEIRDYPERFSPNVVMRPLYQEIILPNLAYIGGGSELVYWLQLEQCFDAFKVDFPILLLRNSAMITDESFGSKLCRLHIPAKDIFKSTEILQKEWVLRNSQNVLNLSDERKDFQSVFEKIKLRAYKIDPTLAPSTEAVKARLYHTLENLEKKFLKGEKKNHEGALSQIEGLRTKYFPGNSLQERSENFGLFFVKYGDDFIAELVKRFKPLDFKFTIIEP
ncbi:bacillithiol biosynthesis cysteine-adding enzyme BshC [Arcticibacter eurypsychrophilus]|uniref:bacillithiol biosynthesis cysteine-adding enzyme BshC n=1 Tax=Arcticibacter eurypsychrophilus TaxID=1434752 RepID=UPI00084D4844|nr:bacillithiol biosynthesis cysteine-adding enzyme BshC [Arcticibacter eurypsychrophilus]